MTLSTSIFGTPLLLYCLNDKSYGKFFPATDWDNDLNLLELGISGSLLALLVKAMGKSLFITWLPLLLPWKEFGITGQFLAVLAGNIGFQVLMSWDGLRSYPDVFSAIKDHKAHIPIEIQLWQLNWSTFTLRLSSQLG
jgi:hypothetical protein